MSPISHLQPLTLRSLLCKVTLTVGMVLALGACGGGNPSDTPAGNSIVTPIIIPKRALGTPKELVAQALASNHVTLSWKVGEGDTPTVQYRVYRGDQPNTALATTSSPQYDDLSAIGGMHYSYYIHAVDVDGNVSAASNTVVVLTPNSTDSSAPTPPANLRAQSISSARVDLTWLASQDNVGVAKYLITRSDLSGVLAETTDTQYVDMTVIGAKQYTYTVRAADASNNQSAPSNTAETQTPDNIDKLAPTIPGNVAAKAVSSTQVEISWTASTDNDGVSKYQISRTGYAGILTQTTLTSYSDTTLTGNSSYSYTVRALDAANNASSWSPGTSVTTPAAPDTVAPSTPNALTATAPVATEVRLSWAASTDNVGVVKYQIFRVGYAGVFAEATSPYYIDKTVVGAKSYTYHVIALDAANNASTLSLGASVTTPATPGPDTLAPSTPSSVTATAPVATEVHLSWAASTDNVGVVKYQVFRVGYAGVLAEARSPQYIDKMVVGATKYTYYVTALDAANNVSTLSLGASVTTPAAPDTAAPSIPGGLTATALSATQVKLTWNASTDNVGVAKYQIFRSGTTSAVAENTTTNFVDTGVNPATTYTYQVKAVDAANNASSLSTSVSVTTPATPVGARPTRDNTGPRTALTDITPDQFMATRTCKNQRIVGDVNLDKAAMRQTYTFTDCEITGRLYAYYSGNNVQPTLDEMPIVVMTYTDVFDGIWLQNLVKLTMDYSYSRGGQWTQTDAWGGDVPGPASITVTNSMFYRERVISTTAHTEALHVYTKASGFRFTNVAFVQQGPDAGTATASINFTGTDSIFDSCWFLWDGPAAAQFTVYVNGTNNVVRNSWFAKGKAGYIFFDATKTIPATYINSHDVDTGQPFSYP